VAHLLNDGTQFIDNIQAEPGTVGGLGLTGHRSFGLDPSALRLVTDVRLEGAGGAFDYVRGAGDATVSRNIGRHLAGALTASAGWSGGRLPVQRLWYLGGSQTVRGQIPGTAAGDAYWMGRAELGTSVVSVRPVVFYDIGWAGGRDQWRHPGTPLSGAGVGASFLDGLVRFDVARGIQPEQRTRVDLYLEARF
jgi:hemolysin activation/secretion protein